MSAPLPSGISARTIIIPGTTRTSLYVVDGRASSANPGKVLLQVNAQDCKTYVCGLCILGQGQHNQFGNKACFDTSLITQDVNILVPDVPEVILGGSSCVIESEVTLGPDPECYDATNLETAVFIAQARSGPVTIKIFPGTYVCPQLDFSNWAPILQGQSDNYEDVVIVPNYPLATDYFLRYTGSADMNISNLTLDLRGNFLIGQTLDDAVLQDTTVRASAYLHNVRVLTNDNFSQFNSYVMRFRRTFTLSMTQCVFDQGTDDTGFLPFQCVNILLPNSVVISQCTFGNVDSPVNYSNTTLFISAASHPTSSSQNPSSAFVSDSRVTCAGAYACTLQAIDNGTISVESCVLGRAGVSSISFRTAASSNPGSTVIQGCRFFEYGIRAITFFGGSFPENSFSLMGCSFDSSTGTMNNTIMSSAGKYTSHAEERIICNQVSAPILNSGEGKPSSLASMVGKTFFPEYVFIESGGVFSANLAPQFLVQFPISPPVVLEEPGDILWVGTKSSTSAETIGVEYVFFFPNSEVRAEVVQGDSFPPPTPGLSKFIYTMSDGTYDINFQQPFAPGSPSSVIAMPYDSQRLASSGTVNGISGKWIGLRRIDSGSTSTISVADILLVEPSTRFRNIYEPLNLIPRASLKYLNLDMRSASMTGGFPPLLVLYVGITQQIRSFTLQGEGVSGGEQGVCSQANLRGNVDVSKQMSVRVTWAAVGGDLTTASLRVQVGCRSVESGFLTLVSSSPLLSENPNHFDSGFITLPAVADENVQTMEVFIPAGTFVQRLPIQSGIDPLPVSSAYTFFVCISRDVTQGTDNDVGGVAIVSAELGYVEV